MEDWREGVEDGRAVEDGGAVEDGRAVEDGGARMKKEGAAGEEE